MPSRTGAFPGRKGKSLGNVSRGDKTPIELFAAGAESFNGALHQHLILPPWPSFSPVHAQSRR